MTRHTITHGDDQVMLEAAQRGDEASLCQLFQQHRPRLLLMIRARLNPQLQRRIDDADILQDAYTEAVARLPDFLAAPRAPFFLWLRRIVHEKIIDVHRRHLKWRLRDVRREVPVRQAATSSMNVHCLADNLVGKLTSPSRAAMRKEVRQQLVATLESMDELDREILSLRHFEELTNKEAAAELEIDSSAASKRYLRALQRMKTKLNEMGLHGGPSSAGASR